ncbi:MAG: polyprenyl synthetase family protein [Planctomycetota bacterium]
MTTSTAPDALNQFLRDSAHRVDAALEQTLPPEEIEPRAIHRAMRYSVFAGGKRLRPALVFLGARCAGGDDDDVLPVACAVEMIHTYSLIHDDLPAMDDDDLRRGKPSCHAVFGEAHAILAGDALHTLAFETLAGYGDGSRVADLVGETARACGTLGMVGGQVADLENEGQPPDVQVVEGIHRRKTGALITACLRLGAIAAGGGEEVLRQVTHYGDLLGLAFQIVDDVLDEEGESEDLGKTPGKDRRRGKMTYPAALGIEASRTRARDLAAGAREAAESLLAGDLLANLADLVVQRRS